MTKCCLLEVIAKADTVKEMYTPLLNQKVATTCILKDGFLVKMV